METRKNNHVFNIGLLQCDHVLEEHRRSAGGDYLQIYQEVFLPSAKRIDLSHDIQIIKYEIIDGIFPESTNECDAWIIAGSKFNIFDDEEWILKLKSFTCRLIEEKRTLIGICFGHQLIASLLGGKVIVRQQWVVGQQNIEFTENAWIKSRTAKLLGCHKCEVVNLPSEVKIIGTTNAIRISFFYLNNNILCSQYHFDLKAEYLKELIEYRRYKIGDNNCDMALKSIRENELNNEIITDDFLRFMTKNSS